MTITPATHAISINPATGEQLSVLPWAGADDIENALQLAAAGFRDWRETNIDYRAEKLRDIGKALRARSEEMAQMITREMGKPINQARAEVAKSANLCDWYAEHGPAMLKAEPTLVENQQAVIEYRPLGTILAIMPWNFPLWQVMRGAVPIILAGNGYLLKHAPNVMGCAQLIAQVFKDAGIPQGVYGSMVFTSGQIPVCPQTGEIPADVQDQARLSLENVKAIVVAAGLSVGDIIKMTVFITDLNDFATINEVYKQFFDEHQATYPTRSCVQVARLPKDVKLEIEAIAVRSA